MQLAEAELKIARADFLEACDWQQMPNGSWVHVDVYSLCRHAENANLELDRYANPEHLFLDAKQACAVAAHALTTDALRRQLQHVWVAIGNAGDADDMTVYRCKRCGKHATVNGSPDAQGCTGSTEKKA